MGSALVMVGDISDLIEGCSASVFLFYLLVIIGLIIMKFTHSSEEHQIFKVYYYYVERAHHCMVILANFAQGFQFSVYLQYAISDPYCSIASVVAPEGYLRFPLKPPST